MRLGIVAAWIAFAPITAGVIAESRLGAQSSPSYRTEFDRAVAHGGAASQHLASPTATAAEFGSNGQAIRADKYRGKRVRFSAWVKTHDATGKGGGLWLRVDGDGRGMVLDNMQSRAISGTQNWTQVSIVVDVPRDAIGISFGQILYGPGEAWIDDATFEIVGAKVLVTAEYFPQSHHWETTVEQRNRYSRLPLGPTNLGFEP